MVNKARITCLASLSLIALLVSCSLLAVHADSMYVASEQNEAFSCLKNVLNINLSHYTVQQKPLITLPSAPNDKSVTEQVSYNLTSSDSQLYVVFLFKDGSLYQLALSTLSGSIVTARNYTNLNDAAVDFLSRYQTVSSVDLTPLIRMVEMLNGSMDKTEQVGNLTLYANSGPILPGHTSTAFHWVYSTDNSSVGVYFDNGDFYNFEYTGFTAQDSQAAENALPPLSQTSTTMPPNVDVKSQPSTAPSPDQQAKQTEQTLTFMIAIIAVIIGAASVIMAYQWLRGNKAKATVTNPDQATRSVFA